MACYVDKFTLIFFTSPVFLKFLKAVCCTKTDFKVSIEILAILNIKDTEYKLISCL
jgi:hypothetical protein